MSEEKLNEKYICEKTLLDENDELVPIIRKMLSEAYVNGLEQSRFDKRMLEQENQLLRIIVENLKFGVTLNEKQEKLLDSILFRSGKHE